MQTCDFSIIYESFKDENIPLRHIIPTNSTEYIVESTIELCNENRIFL